jgi:hypothetical protein
VDYGENRRDNKLNTVFVKNNKKKFAFNFIRISKNNYFFGQVKIKKI